MTAAHRLPRVLALLSANGAVMLVSTQYMLSETASENGLATASAALLLGLLGAGAAYIEMLHDEPPKRWVTSWEIISLFCFAGIAVLWALQFDLPIRRLV